MNEYTLHQRGNYWVAVDNDTGFTHSPCVCPKQAHAGPARGGRRTARRTAAFDWQGNPIVPDDNACTVRDPDHAWTHMFKPDAPVPS
jgi:hypothetical protein